MKYIIIISLTFISLQFACTPPKSSDSETKQSNYTISGRITGIEGEKMIYLYNKEGNYFIDSCLVQNGKFSLKGVQNDPVTAVLKLSKKGSRLSGKSFLFYLENADYRLNTTYLDFEKIQLDGNSKVNKDFIKYRNVIDEIEKEMHSLSSAMMESEMSGEVDEKNTILYEAAMSKYRTAQKNYIQENPNTYPTLDILISYSVINEQLKKHEHLRDVMQPDMSDDELKASYQMFSDDMKNSSKGKALYNSLYFPYLMQGDQYVELEDTYTMDGKGFKISDLKTDYVLLDFTGIYCGACKKFNKQMKPEYDIVKDKLTIVAFYTDADKEGIIKSTQKDGIKWMVVSDFKGKNSPNMKRYKVSGIPDFYLLGKDRKIIEHKVGVSDEFIKYLLSLN
ncbi:DUF4369 domain-containing protein [Marinifilum sp.]|uniref:DUF4369 domain-containing protein n=1 Tax=Marinifilum sp. TaxID=2033137 RepID=UPI003BAAFC7D